MVRLFGGALLALVITFFLFALMQQLIHQGNAGKEESGVSKIADIYMGNTEIEALASERKPERPEEQKQLPPEVEPPSMQSLDVKTDKVVVNPSLKMELSQMQGPALSASDGEYLPMVKVQPQYPSVALSRGIEGYCIVEYTVTKTGSVRDPVAIDCDPLFKSASIKAAEKFKYKPRIENGEPIEVPGVQNKFTYKLSE
jgi:protein TonB